MKKTIITILAVAMLVAVFGGVSSAYAMEDAGKGPGNGTAAAGENGTSILSTYMTDAAATALGLDVTEVEERLAAGETFYDIALSLGYTPEFIPEFLASLQASAAEAAAADGLVPQTQLNTNLGIQSQLNDGTCDGTGDCVSDPIPNLYSGSNAGMQGRRGGR
jgi:hypothetical protein